MSDVTTTDLYEVTMALSYLREDMWAPATFSLFVRDLPPGRGFLVTAGLEPALDFLADYRVEREDVEEFAAALHRPVRDLEPLLGPAFEGEVRAVPEGRAVFAGEPGRSVPPWTPPPSGGSGRGRPYLDAPYLDAAYLDAAYKLVEYDGRPVMKLSSAKVTAPGRKQVFRRAGQPDVIALWREEPPDSARPLLRR